MPDYTAVGKSVPRMDAWEKVTGRAIYGPDLRQEGMLYGAILRSPHAHARIVNLDSTRAERLPGVRAVICGRDVPDLKCGVLIRDQGVFATDKVRHLGEKVAAVAATSPEVAQEALELIRVEYQELPAVLDPLEALKPEAPVIHEDLKRYEAANIFGFVDPSALWGNVCGYVLDERGNVQEGFAQSDLVVENTFTTPMVHQGYLEPHGAIAYADERGEITVWVSTQGLFVTRALLAQAFRVPLTKVRVVPVTVGGGFGGKLVLLITPVCVLLSRRTGRPVQITMTREEEFIDATPRHPSVITLKSGVKKDGTLLALESRVVMDTGAYAHMGPNTATRGALITKGPYRIPHTRLEGIAVYTNKVSAGAYRAPGFPQATFALESQLDILAERLSLDPLEIRLKNSIGEGDLSFAGQKLKRTTLPTVLKQVADRIGWGRDRDEGAEEQMGRGSEEKKAPRLPRGVGIAAGQWNVMGVPAGAIIKLEEDGEIVVMTGSVDLTGSNTVLAQVAAEELGVPWEEVRVFTEDTATAVLAPVSGGSMTGYNMGNAVRLAAGEVKARLFELAARRLDVRTDQLEIRDKKVFPQGAPEKGLSLAQLAAISLREGGLIIGRGSSTPLLPHLVVCAQAAEVEVDPETGTVTLLRLVAGQDVGFALNPAIVEGQIQGGVVQGVGFALSEQMIFQQGAVANPNFSDFKLPTALDVPPLEQVLVEHPSEVGPYGAKGVGEPPTVPTAAAIANAVYAAVGARVKDLPVTPQRVWEAMKSSKLI